MNIISVGQNIRKLRDERNITQQQLADSLGVTSQAVSKWECGTTVPDIAMLPEIADYFSVTIDELFKPGMTAYRNKAERLLSKYESDINNSETFELANKEYTKLISENSATATDIGSYAYLNDLRSQYYLKLTEAYYRQAIGDGKKQKDVSYYKNQRQYILFLSRLGRQDESINRHVSLLEQEPNNPMNYSSLVAAYQCAADNENAIKIAEKGLSMFPNDVILLVYAGDTYKHLSEFDKAIECWNKAFEIDPEMIDTQYSLAFYLMEIGEYIKAKEVFTQIKEWNYQRGFYIENRWINAELNKLEAKV
jgi:transcriptional regulator with XRE-family HTH domain